MLLTERQGDEMLNMRNDADSMQQLLGLPKRIVLYGAGASARLILQAFYHKGLERRLAFIVDKNESLDNTWCEAPGGIQVKVISLQHFLKQYGSQIKEEFTMLITPFGAMWIVDELDKVEGLDGVDAYVYALVAGKKTPSPFRLRSLSEPMIPKRIHYIWIGDNAMSREDIKNIESWKRFCPGYEIIRWDERNYDFRRNPYTREALEKKQYMYATDYARKDILYHYGGIYLDTDVELLRTLDDLLYNKSFIGIEDGGQLNSGSGLGAVAGHPAMLGMMEAYEGVHFILPDGNCNWKYNTFYETSYMLGRGYELENRYQEVDGVVCLPREVLMPESNMGLYDAYTENTLSNHKINPYDKTGVRKVLGRICGEHPIPRQGGMEVPSCSR